MSAVAWPDRRAPRHRAPDALHRLLYFDGGSTGRYCRAPTPLSSCWSGSPSRRSRRAVARPRRSGRCTRGRRLDPPPGVMSLIGELTNTAGAPAAFGQPGRERRAGRRLQRRRVAERERRERVQALRAGRRAERPRHLAAGRSGEPSNFCVSAADEVDTEPPSSSCRRRRWPTNTCRGGAPGSSGLKPIATPRERVERARSCWMSRRARAATAQRLLSMQKLLREWAPSPVQGADGCDARIHSPRRIAVDRRHDCATRGAVPRAGRVRPVRVLPSVRRRRPPRSPPPTARAARPPSASRRAAERRLPHRARRPRRRAEAPGAAEHEPAGDEQRQRAAHGARGGGLEERARLAERAEAEQRADEAAEEVGAAAEERRRGAAAAAARSPRPAAQRARLGDQRDPGRRKVRPKPTWRYPLSFGGSSAGCAAPTSSWPRRRTAASMGGEFAGRVRAATARASARRHGAELDALADEERRDHGEPRRRVACLQPRAEQQLEEQQQQRAGEDAVLPAAARPARPPLTRRRARARLGWRARSAGRRATTARSHRARRRGGRRGSQDGARTMPSWRRRPTTPP